VTRPTRLYFRHDGYTETNGLRQASSSGQNYGLCFIYESDPDSGELEEALYIPFRGPAAEAEDVDSVPYSVTFPTLTVTQPEFIYDYEMSVPLGPEDVDLTLKDVRPNSSPINLYKLQQAGARIDAIEHFKFDFVQYR
jgi:hypothetical protein